MEIKFLTMEKKLLLALKKHILKQDFEEDKFPYSGNGNSLFTILEKVTCNFYHIPILNTFILGKVYQMHDRILNSE